MQCIQVVIEYGIVRYLPVYENPDETLLILTAKEETWRK